MKRALAIVAAALVVVAASYAAVALFGGSDGDPPATEAAGVAPLGTPLAAPAGGPDTAELDRLIGVFESRTADRTDLTDLEFLGLLYLRKATITNDVPLYVQAATTFDQVLDTWADNWTAATGLAAAQLATHDFDGALATTDRVLAAEPSRVDAMASRGDALLALGDHEAAGEQYQELEAALPAHPAVEARLAAVAFLLGDTARANSLLAVAVEYAVGSGLSGADLAWYHAARAELQLSQGRLDRAETHFDEALAADPAFAAALGGLAHIRAAQGRYDDAIDLYRQALDLAPDLGLLAELGDAHTLAGDDAAARTAYDEVVAALRLAEGQSEAYNRTLLMFYADHDVEPAEALRLAEQEIAARQDVAAYDALAWALYRNGRLEEARAASEQALRLGTPEAAFWYHAGLISAGLGDQERAIQELAQALDLNPAFDPLQALRAQEALARLSGGA